VPRSPPLSQLRGRMWEPPPLSQLRGRMWEPPPLSQLRGRMWEARRGLQRRPSGLRLRVGGGGRWHESIAPIPALREGRAAHRPGG
jgi:hypothetical protein